MCGFEYDEWGAFWELEKLLDLSFLFRLEYNEFSIKIF